MKASSRSTNGSLALYESTVNGRGAPLHVHTREDETFYVLTGILEVECGDDQFTAGLGSVVFMPRNLPHTFRSVGGPATVLLIVTPGRLDDFFVERDAAVAAGADRGELARIAKTYGF